MNYKGKALEKLSNQEVVEYFKTLKEMFVKKNDIEKHICDLEVIIKESVI